MCDFPKLYPATFISTSMLCIAFARLVGHPRWKNLWAFLCFLAITSSALLCWILSGFFVLIVLCHSWVSQVFTPSMSRLACCCSLSHKFWIGINYDNSTLVDCLFSRDYFDCSVIHTWSTDKCEAVIGGVWLYCKRGVNPTCLLLLLIS